MWIIVNLRLLSASDSNAEAMTATKVNLCLDEIFKRTDDEVQVFEGVQFDSPGLYLRHLRRTDLLMNLFTGKVVDLATVTGVQSSFETVEDAQLQLRARDPLRLGADSTRRRGPARRRDERLPHDFAVFFAG